MANTAYNFVKPQYLTNAIATYYTVPTGTRAIVRKLTFTNTSASVKTVTVYWVPSGGSAGNSNKIVPSYSIAPSETWDCPFMEAHTMHAGDKLQILASDNTAVMVASSGSEVTGSNIT